MSDFLERLRKEQESLVNQTPTSPAAPQSVTNFLQGVASNPVGKGALDILSFVGTVLQPLAAPQQILFGTASEIYNTALKGLGRNDEYQVGSNLMKGVTSAGSYLTYGLLDNKNQFGESITREQNALSAIPTVQNVFKSLGLGDEAGWFAGMAVDILSDPTNLLGGAGAAAKTGKFAGFGNKVNGAVFKLQNALELEAQVAGKVNATRMAQARAIASENSRFNTDLQLSNPDARLQISPDVSQIAQSFEPRLNSLQADLDTARVASARYRKDIEMANKLIRIGDTGGLNLVAGGINAVTDNGLVRLADTVTTKLSQVANQPITYAARTARVAKTDAEASKYGVKVGERYVVSGKPSRPDDLPAATKRTGGGIVGDALGKLGISPDITWGELFLQNKQLAQLGRNDEIAGTGVQGGRVITIGEQRERIDRVGKVIGGAAADHINRVAGQALETLQRLRSKVATENDYDKIQASLYRMQAATTQKELRTATQTFNTLVSAYPVEVKRLALLARKQSNTLRSHGGLLLGGEQPSRAPMSGISIEEYDEIVGAIDNAPDSRTAMRVADQAAQKLAAKNLTPEEYGLRQNDQTSLLSLVDQIKIELVGSSVAGERFGGVGLSPAQVQLDPKLEAIAGKAFAEQARERFTAAKPSARFKLAETIAQEAAQEAYRQMQPHLTVAPSVAARQIKNGKSKLEQELKRLGDGINDPSPDAIASLSVGIQRAKAALGSLRQRNMASTTLLETLNDMETYLQDARKLSLQERVDILTDLQNARGQSAAIKLDKIRESYNKAMSSWVDIAEESVRTSTRLETLSKQKQAIKDQGTVIDIAKREEIVQRLLNEERYQDVAQSIATGSFFSGGQVSIERGIEQVSEVRRQYIPDPSFDENPFTAKELAELAKPQYTVATAKPTSKVPTKLLRTKIDFDKEPSGSIVNQRTGGMNEWYDTLWGVYQDGFLNGARQRFLLTENNSANVNLLNRVSQSELEFSFQEAVASLREKYARAKASGETPDVSLSDLLSRGEADAADTWASFAEDGGKDFKGRYNPEYSVEEYPDGVLGETVETVDQSVIKNIDVQQFPRSNPAAVAIGRESVLRREINLAMELASTKTKSLDSAKTINRIASLLSTKEDELAALSRVQRIIDKRKMTPELRRVKAEVAQKAKRIADDIKSARDFLENDDEIANLLSLDLALKPALQQSPLDSIKESIKSNRSVLKNLRTQAGEQFQAMSAAEKRALQLDANEERSLDARMIERSKIAKEQEKVDAKLASLADERTTMFAPQDLLDIRAVLRAEGLDDFTESIVSTPSMIRQEYALNDFGGDMLESMRLRTDYQQPSISLDPSRLTRLLEQNFPDIKEGERLATTMESVANSRELSARIEQVWRQSPELGAGENTNLRTLLEITKERLGLDQPTMQRLFKEIVTDGAISTERRSSRTAARSLELSGYGDKTAGRKTTGDSLVDQRKILGDQVRQELGEYQNIAFSIERNASAIGRVVVERGMRHELRQIVEDGYGQVWNYADPDLPEDIEALKDAGQLVRLEQGDAFEIFRRGDLVPPIVARQIQISNVTQSDGALGLFNLIRQTRAVFSGVKLGTPASLVRQVLGGFALADAAGYSPIELGRGIGKYFDVMKAKARGNDTTELDELLSSGAMHTNFFKSEQQTIDELKAEAQFAGDTKLGGLIQGIMRYKLEQSGAAKGILNNDPQLQRLARIGGIEIGVGAVAGAVAGTAVLPVLGTAVGAAAGAIAGATAGGSLGLNRKFFEMFGQAEEMLRAGIYFAARERGESVADSAELAIESMYNYQARPVLAAAAEKIGMPFQTFASIATTKTLEQLYLRPARLARSVSLPERAERGRDSDEARRERDAMTGYMRENALVPLPFKDSEGRTYYLPLQPLLSSQQLDGLLRVAGSPAKGLENLTKTINQLPVAQLVSTVAFGTKWNGQPTYSDKKGFFQTSDDEKLQIALQEVLNQVGYPTQLGSPLMQGIARQASKYIETNESLAARFGSDPQTTESLLTQYTLSVIDKGIAAFGERAIMNPYDPSRAAPKDSAGIASQTIGLTTQTIQGDVSKPGERSNAVKTVQFKMQDLQRQYRKALETQNPSTFEKETIRYNAEMLKLQKELERLLR